MTASATVATIAPNFLPSAGGILSGSGGGLFGSSGGALYSSFEGTTAEVFAQRLAALFPPGWASPDALTGGVAYAFLLAQGTGLAEVLNQFVYAANAVLIGTETAPELDLASQDFFGTALPRPPGATDATFAALIVSNLFLRAATRGAISAALTGLTGKTPRMIEPWNPGDTGAWDTPGSYWDVDSAAAPFRWTGEERATGLIISAPAIATNALGGNPLYGWDSPGLYWDEPGGQWADIQLSETTDVYALVDKLRAYGVTVGVQIVPNPQ